MQENPQGKTRLSGREFSPQEIEDIQETVRMFDRLSWSELLRTVCEHLDWVTPAGRYKLTACAQALRALEGQGLLKVPPKSDLEWTKARPQASARTDPGEELSGTVRDWEPVTVLPASERERGLWNEYIHRYHPLGYQRAFGAHQRYFIRTRGERLAGCLLFASSAWALSARDEWIGWGRQDRARRLNWVVTNTRFLLFPWVRVKNLASRALSLVARRIRQDWQGRYAYEPVLLETFVDTARHRGVCYQAANWIHLGTTQGRGRMDRDHQFLSTPKAIYAYPLVRDFRSWLRGEKS
jgi:hypothetical protein